MAVEPSVASGTSITVPVRFADLFPQIASFGNLRAAYHAARKAGRTRPAVARFDYRLEENIHDLREDLLAGTYQPGGYRSFYVQEPKRRLVSAAPFRDRPGR